MARIAAAALAGGLAIFLALLSVTAVQAAPPVLTLGASDVEVGQTTHATATLAEAPDAGGEITFMVFGPGDSTCSGTGSPVTPAAVSGEGEYASGDFTPEAAGDYSWSAEYTGDGVNEPANAGCTAFSVTEPPPVVATVTLTASATSGTVGEPVAATATLADGANPAGEIVFQAFPPADTDCSGVPAFVSTVTVAGNGSYGSGPFVPSTAGSYLWTVAYSGDLNNSPASLGCGAATSNVSPAEPSPSPEPSPSSEGPATPSISSVSPATPSILGWVSKKTVLVGESVRAIAALQGASSPGGRITFRVYAPGTANCAKAMLANSVAVAGPGPFESASYTPEMPGTYTFLASYSGDAGNRPASEACGSPLQVLNVLKRSPKVAARVVLEPRGRISLGARLSGSFDPSGRISFRLYRPGDSLCRSKPVFSGSTTARKNGKYSLGEYLATRHGLYRLVVGYSGDPRNKRYAAACRRAQTIRFS